MHIPQLVLFDADHIKEYVFTTGRLKELRGASEQVRRLTDFGARHKASIFDEFDLKVWQPGADEGVIYASGGAGATRRSVRGRAEVGRLVPAQYLIISRSRRCISGR